MLARTTCPHCLTAFEPADALAVATHEGLRGDLRLGPDAMMRFRPGRFTAAGTPLDPFGLPSPHLACPRCHLGVPAALLDAEPFFVSILGAPACGKSFFLAALTWEARRTLPACFSIDFGDADPAANVTLSDYEKAVFLPGDPDALTPLGGLIEKTRLDGAGLYSAVDQGGRPLRYARPFLFTLRPVPPHPHAGAGLDRVLCLYDNAGEHFQPGSESASAPVTRHLARSNLLVFLFDPTMDPRFRAEYGAGGGRSERQESILREAAARVRRMLELPDSARHAAPLVVALTKADEWGHLLPGDAPAEPWAVRGGPGALDAGQVQRRSGELRRLLGRLCPEVVGVAEGFAESVTYMPVSVLGRAPELMATDSGAVPAVRPRDIVPRGVLTPLLFGLAAGPRLVPLLRTGVLSGPRG